MKEERPENFTTASFDSQNRELVIAFTFNGGSNEDKIFVLKFEQAVAFHIPSVLREYIIFHLAPYTDAHQYIRAISFDEEEFGEKGYKIVVLSQPFGDETEYYIAAESVQSEWISYQEGKRQWNI